MSLSEDRGAALAAGLPLGELPLTGKKLARNLEGRLKDASEEEALAGPSEPLAGSCPIRSSLTDTGT
jgi:hypothetical protein